MLILDRPTIRLKNPSQNARNLKEYMMKSYKIVTRSKPKLDLVLLSLKKEK